MFNKYPKVYEITIIESDIHLDCEPIKTVFRVPHGDIDLYPRRYLWLEPIISRSSFSSMVITFQCTQLKVEKILVKFPETQPPKPTNETPPQPLPDKVPVDLEHPKPTKNFTHKFTTKHLIKSMLLEIGVIGGREYDHVTFRHNGIRWVCNHTIGCQSVVRYFGIDLRKTRQMLQSELDMMRTELF